MRLLRRYKSDIYGNYRLAYLRDGALTGLVLSVAVLVCKLLYYPIYAPENYVTDIALLVSTLFFAYRYRSRLPEKKVFFKELMLFGIGTALVACFLYGLYIFVSGYIMPGQIELFVKTAIPSGAYEEYPAYYWSALLGMWTAVKMAVLGALFMFEI